MKKSYIFLAIAAFGLAASCQNLTMDEPSVLPGQHEAPSAQSFKAVAGEFGPDTRTYIGSDLYTYWVKEDQIALFSDMEQSRFMLGQGGGRISTFYNITGEYFELDRYVSGIYPFSCVDFESMHDGGEMGGGTPLRDADMAPRKAGMKPNIPAKAGSYNVYVPEVQFYCEGSFDPEAAIMWARGNAVQDGCLEFHNAMGILSIKLYSDAEEPVHVKRIKVTSVRPVSGPAMLEIPFADGEFALANQGNQGVLAAPRPTETKGGYIINHENHLWYNGDGYFSDYSVTLVCDDVCLGGSAFDPTVFNILVIPDNHCFSIEVTTTDDHIMLFYQKYHQGGIFDTDMAEEMGGLPEYCNFPEFMNYVTVGQNDYLSLAPVKFVPSEIEVDGIMMLDFNCGADVNHPTGLYYKYGSYAGYDYYGNCCCDWDDWSPEIAEDDSRWTPTVIFGDEYYDELNGGMTAEVLGVQKADFDPCPDGWRICDRVIGNDFEYKTANLYGRTRNYQHAVVICGSYFPMAGYDAGDGSVADFGLYGTYWTAEGSTFGFDDDGHVQGDDDRTVGRTVRCQRAEAAAINCLRD